MLREHSQASSSRGWEESDPEGIDQRLASIRSATEGSSVADASACAVDSAWTAVSKGGIAWPNDSPPVGWEVATQRVSAAFARLPNGDRWLVPPDYAAFIHNRTTGWQWFNWYELFGPELVASHTCSLVEVWDYEDGDGLWMAVGSWACRHEWYLGCNPAHPSWGRVVDAEDTHPRHGKFVGESFVDFLLGWLAPALATYRERHPSAEPGSAVDGGSE